MVSNATVMERIGEVEENTSVSESPPFKARSPDEAEVVSQGVRDHQPWAIFASLVLRHRGL
jgi:hypothetical protein